MIVREDTDLKDRILNSLISERRRTTDKLHVTNAICCVGKPIYERYGVKKQIDERAILSMAQGRGDHSIIEEFFPVKEKLVILDGFVGTIDAVGDRITEIFTTSLSSNNSIETMMKKSAYFYLKIRQMKAYCKMSNVEEINLVVLFRFGNYDYKNRGPKLNCYLIHFFKSEIEENWTLMNKKKDIIHEWQNKNSIDQIPFDPIKGECLYCSFSHMCECVKKDVSEEEVEEIPKELERDFVVNGKNEVF